MYPEIPIYYTNEDCGALSLARVRGWTGALVTQATLSSIAYKVVDLDAAATVTASGTLTISAVIFDTAQTDGSWPFSDGYNFRWLIPASAFPTGGHRYAVEFTFTPVAPENQPFAVDFEIRARNRSS